jgi:hypothetical protein
MDMAKRKYPCLCKELNPSCPAHISVNTLTELPEGNAIPAIQVKFLLSIKKNGSDWCSTLKMEAARSSEMSVPNSKSTWHHNPEDLNLEA